MGSRKSFVFYDSYIESALEIEDHEERLEFLQGLIFYSLNDKEFESNSAIVRALFKAIKPTLDSSRSRYDASVENGKKGGAPKGNQNARKKPKSTKNNLNQPKNNLNYNDNVNDNYNLNDNVVSKDTYKSVIDSYTQNEELKEALNNYVEMRKSMKGFTVNALKLNLKKLDELGANDRIKIDIVNQSVECSWKTFYPISINERKDKREELIF